MSWHPDNEENPFGDPSIDEARKTNAPTTVSPRDSSMNANHTPSWIEDVPPSNSNSQNSSSGSGYTPPPTSFPTDSANIRDSQMSNDNTQNQNTQDSGNTPTLVVYMRVVNLVAAFILILFSILSLLPTGSFSFTSFIIACYLICFSCLLCCFEMRIRQISSVISKNFGFMFTWQSRTAFLLFYPVLGHR